jgi:hypothetical protein
MTVKVRPAVPLPTEDPGDKLDGKPAGDMGLGSREFSFRGLGVERASPALLNFVRK